MGDEPKHLFNLNEAQLAAVTHEPTIPLQILAGPGSGKTRTLTCRIAHLIEKHGVPPSKIVAVTFTNKAANELRVRLENLIGPKASSALILGTFHAICGRLLRQHGSKIKVANNFTILDTDECKKLINAIIRDAVAMSGAHSSGGKKFDMKDGLVMELISKIKAKGLSPDEFEAKAQLQSESKNSVPKGDMDPFLAQQLSPIYTKYVENCKRNNALDFDDLLMYGVKLLDENNDCVDCQHIFVDEFQDTNAIQFRLMTLFAKRRRNISVVGDPDQSIYGWRSAEIENLDKMIALFPKTKQIYLEDNYRSTGAILAASIAIISQDTSRPPKTLRTSHPAGAPVTLGNCADEHEEAACIAEEIKRLKVTSGGLFKWSDFSILLRFNALSRNIETALQKEGIPSRVLAGQKFFDRAEVKDLVAYLQLIDNPNFDQAAYRVLNVPKRNIGEKSIHELRLRAKKLNKPVMFVVEKIVEGRIPDISPSLQQKAKPFIQVIRNLRDFALKGTPVSELIERALKELSYADHLHKSYQDWETRWENVRELITFATDVTPASDPEDGTSNTAAQELDDEGSMIIAEQNNGLSTTVEATYPSVIDLTEDEEAIPDQAEVVTPLRLFLQNTSLSTDTMVRDDESKTEKVTISTCHAAKGLEWPVVFIPSVEEGTFPFYRTEDIEEERRLLYVACTRAQVLLYLTATKQRKGGGETRDQKLSRYLTDVIEKDKKRTLFTDKKPSLNYTAFRLISKVLERECPSTEEVEQGERDYYKAQSANPTPPSTTQTTSSSQLSPVEPQSSQGKPISKSFRFKSVTDAASQLPAGSSHPAVFSTARVIANSLLQTQNLPPVTPGTRSIPAVFPRSKGASTSTGSGSSSAAGTSSGLREKSQNISSKPITSFFRPQVPSGTRAPMVSTPAVPAPLPVAVPVVLPPQLTGQTAFTVPRPPLALPPVDGTQPPAKVAGTKRRLGMSTSGPEFPRKK